MNVQDFKKNVTGNPNHVFQMHEDKNNNPLNPSDEDKLIGWYKSPTDELLMVRMTKLFYNSVTVDTQITVIYDNPITFRGKTMYIVDITAS